MIKDIIRYLIVMILGSIVIVGTIVILMQTIGAVNMYVLPYVSSYVLPLYGMFFIFVILALFKSVFK